MMCVACLTQQKGAEGNVFQLTGRVIAGEESERESDELC